MARRATARRPKGVKQKEEWGCWAACMEAWTSSVYYWDTRGYDSFAREYGGSKDSLNTSGEEFGRLVKAYALNITFFDQNKLCTQIVYNLLNGQRACGSPREFAMLIEQLTPTASHARLIYNVDTNKDMIDVMEPRTGNFEALTVSTFGKSMLLF